MSRIVLDTNVVIGAIIHGGGPEHLLKKILKDDRHVLVTSPGIFTELVDVLQRPKFDMWNDETAQALRILSTLSDTVVAKSGFTAVKTDPADNMIINTAYDGHADYIVSSDRDLLRMKRFKQTRMVTVTQMLLLL